MAIVYKNGRLVRETSGSTTTTTPASTGGSGGYSPEEIKAIIGQVTSNPKGINLGKSQNPVVLTPEQQAVVGNTGPLTQAQMDIARNFQKNALAEGEARKLALSNEQKARTAWGKQDSDGDGIPNAIDNSNSPPQGGGGKGSTNMAKTPINDYINQQLRAAGLPDTPANRSKLRDEYMKIQATQQADTIKADAASAKAAQDAADNKAAYDAIMKSIGGYETSADTAKTDAMKRLADIYDLQAANLDTQKQDQLNYLQQVLSQAGTDINSSEQNFLSNLITPSAYKDVPLTTLPQQQNALIAALQSQGAGTGEVQAQSNLDASLNDFMKQLSERSSQQYGNAQTNYVDALRNAGMGAAKSGRDYLTLEQPRLQSGINTKYADLAAKLAAERAKAEADAQDRYNKAMADARAKKVEGETKYPQITPTVADAAPPAAGTVDGLTPEQRKKLEEALAGWGGFGPRGF